MASNYPLGITSTDANSEADRDDVGMGAAMFDRVRQLLCGLQGHDSLLQFGQDRMFLKCVSCGHETPGWEISEPSPAVSVQSEPRPRPMARPQLVSERRIA
jgi:hypothetical protein